ncbi:MAG TPA: glycosyltransferase family 2 protein, partial [Polyangia bacterium]|nr:glycosyltransferase family 2 protein [Polyangia bacterium]
SSVLAQDYPSYEVIAVDDRSEDATGSILRELAAAHPALRVARVDVLPAGWLGKTNAMHLGAAVSTGDWILFTDADVLFAPGALRRSVAWVERERLGHGVALPHFIAPGWCERAFVSLFGLLLLVGQRADDLRRAGSRAYIGLGAFNLVRRDAYLAIGGHERLRLEVADDLKLGLVLRRSGVRQGCVDSGGLVSVRWQHGFLASMRGLLKNFFAGSEYSWRRTARTAIGVSLATTFPAAYLAWALGHGSLGIAGGVAALAILISMVLLAAAARWFAFGRGPEGLLIPVMGPCLAAVALASAAGATLRRGIVWRGTRYALADLKAGVVGEAQWPADRAPG